MDPGDGNAYNVGVSTSLETGATVGAYRLTNRIGDGAMGQVFAGEHAALGRAVAVKVLHPWLATDEAYVARLRREARIVSGLEHPNIVEVSDFVTAEGHVALVMERLTGPTLDRVLADGPLAPVQALNLAVQLSDALDRVHAQGIVHRDIKPSNIAVIGDLDTDLSAVPSVKLLDFGVAQVADGTSGGRTLSTAAMGTPAYMAPEQLAAEVPTAAADVYALAEVLYEALTGRPVFSDEGLDSLRVKISGPAPRVRLSKDMPGRAMLEALLSAGLAVDPRERPRLWELRPRLRALRALRS